MASQHILLKSTNKYNSQLRAFIDGATSLVNTGDNLKAIFEQTASGGDYAALAIMLDMSGENAATNAQAIYNVFLGALDEIKADSELSQLRARVG